VLLLQMVPQSMHEMCHAGRYGCHERWRGMDAARGGRDNHRP
jgi:hypothetical protein